MSEPTPLPKPKPAAKRIDLKLVDENFAVPGQGATTQDFATQQIAAAVREGRRRATEQFSIELIKRLEAERDARPTVAEEAKHGRHQRWLGFAVGVPAGMLLACAAIFAMQGIIWDTATRSFREQAMTGALISSHGEQERSDGYINPGQDVTGRP